MGLGDFFAALAHAGIRLELEHGRVFLPTGAPKALREALEQHQDALQAAMGIDPFAADTIAEQEAVRTEGCKRWAKAELEGIAAAKPEYDGIPF